jgi:hypothetical protein
MGSCLSIYMKSNQQRTQIPTISQPHGRRNEDLRRPPVISTISRRHILKHNEDESDSGSDDVIITTKR